MHFQWYPGHMAKARRMMIDDMKLIDVVIELVDARIPLSSKNPDIDSLSGTKSRVILLNKFDMADQRYNKAWKEYFEARGFFVALVNSQSGNGVKQVQDVVNMACAAKIERDRKRGILSRPVRAMVVGIPNVGKSTFINSFVGKASTKTGNKPGVTKGKQWIRINKFIELLDTPGILWHKFEDQKVGLKLALIGSINDNIINTTDLSLELLMFLSKHYPSSLKKRYDVDITEPLLDIKSASELLEQIAFKRFCLIKGGLADLNKAAHIVMDDFRNTRLGNITLEFPKVPKVLVKTENVLNTEENIISKEDNVITMEDNIISNNDNVIIKEEIDISKDENNINKEENVIGNKENIINKKDKIFNKEDNIICNGESV